MTAQSTPRGADENMSPRKRSKTKWFLFILGGILLIILLIVLMLPTLLSTSVGKNIIVSQINNSANGTIEIKDLSFGWFSGLKLAGVSFKDNAGTVHFAVDEVSAKISLLALLHGRISLTEGLIDKPSVELLVPTQMQESSSSTVSSTPSGVSSERAYSSKDVSSSGDSAVILPVDKIALELRQGSAIIKTERPPQTLEFKNIATQVNINPIGQASTLSLVLAIAGVGQPGTVKANATVTPQKMALEGTSGDIRVELINLNLEDFKPLLALAGQKADVAGLVNAQAQVKLTDGQFEKIQADATVENFKQTLGGQTTTLDKPVKIQALAAMTDKGLRVDNLNIDSSFCSATCKGDMTALTYQAKADLSGVQSFTTQFVDFSGYALAGSLNASGSVNFDDQSISSLGAVEFQNLVVAKGTNRLPSTALKINYDLTQDSASQLLKVSSISVVTDAGSVEAKDISVPLDSQKTMQISAQADVALDLQKTLTLARPFAAEALPKDLVLAGALRSKLNVQTRGLDIQFRTDNTAIQNLVVGQTGQTPFTQDSLTLTADGTANPQTKSYAVNFDLIGKKAQSQMRFKGNVSQKAQKDQTAIAGDVQADYNWADMTAMAKPYLPKNFSMTGKRSDKVTFATTYPTVQPEKMLPNLNAVAAVGFDSADFMGLVFGPTQLKLNVQQGKAAIDLPDANVNSGKVRFSGDIDLAANPMSLTLRKEMQVVENVKINEVISANFLQYLIPIFAKSSDVSGTAGLRCRSLVIPLAGGAIKDILVDGDISMTDVNLNSELFSWIKAALREDGLDLFSIPSSPFTVKNALVQYADIPLYFGRTYALHFLNGKIGLEDKKLDMTIQVPYKKSNAMIPLGGTLDKPKPDFSKLLTDNIIEQIPIKDEKTKEAVEKGLQILEGLMKKGSSN